MPKTKAFDCVELQHRGGDAVRKATQGMTPEEEVAYWERQTREFRAEIERRRTRKRAGAR